MLFSDFSLDFRLFYISLELLPFLLPSIFNIEKCNGALQPQRSDVGRKSNVVLVALKSASINNSYTLLVLLLAFCVVSKLT